MKLPYSLCTHINAVFWRAVSAHAEATWKPCTRNYESTLKPGFSGTQGVALARLSAMLNMSAKIPDRKRCHPAGFAIKNNIQACLKKPMQQAVWY